MPQHNPQNKGTKPGGERPIERKRGEDFVRFYANSVEIGISNWDVQIAFGEVIVADDRKVALQEKAIIVMSPQHAKAFLNVLLSNVALFEKQFGVIKVPGVDMNIESKVEEGAPAG